MTSSSSAAVVIGSTGLVGSHILNQLAESNSYQSIHTVSRRSPKTSSSRVNAVVNADTTRWAADMASLTPTPTTFFSALGTTRASAGSIDAQWKIDHDLNVELIKAAKAQGGVRTCVFISSVGSDGVAVKFSPYSQMKKGVEDAIREAGFEHGIIVRPATIYYQGDREERRTMESVWGSFWQGVRRLHAGLSDAMGQDADVIARAAIRAAQMAEEGKAPSKVWVLGGKEILQLGRDEVSSAKPAAS